MMFNSTNRNGLKRCTLCGSIPMLAVVGLLSLFSPQSAGGAEGDLDPSFGIGGRVFTDYSGNDDYSLGVTVQRDGRIIVVGHSGTYPLFHSALARYQRDGNLDQNFGNGGRVIAALDGGGDGLRAVALQADGKIVAAGSLIHNNFETAFLLARFNSNGTLDQGFGTNGSVITRFGDSTAAGNAVVLQPDGRSVVVGVSGAGPGSELNDFALARYNPDGSLDQSFGVGGKVKTHFNGVYNTGSNATAVALQTDGKLLVAGAYKNEATYRAFALARYNPDGSLDSTFGSNGTLTTSLGSGDAFAFGIALQRDGKITLAGYFDAGFRNHDFALVRYHSNGSLDQTFGVGGRVTSDFSGGTDDIAYACTLQRDGKLVVAGRTGIYPSFDFALARYSRTGQLDQSFGNGGKVTSNFGSSEQSYGVKLQPDGKIIVAGIADPNGSTFDFAVARYVGSSRPRQ